MFSRKFYFIAAVFAIVEVAIFTFLPIFLARTKWAQEATISFNELGRNAIGLAIKGNNLVVLTRQSDFKKPLSLDSIYIYTYNGKTWLQQAELTIPEEKPGEGYGNAFK
ncbi:MAG: hypothetical protein WBA41_30355 [Rivularia sp. (in: cyanobacteria)]